MPTLKFPTARDRTQIATTAQGIISENFDRQVNGASSILVDGSAYFMAIGLRAGDIVTNISVQVQTIGATVTLSKVGLYSKAGVQLAASADQGTAWQTTGLKTIAVASPYTVPVDDGYFVCVVSKASVTLPTLVRGVGTNNANAAVGSGMFAIGLQTGQTDLPSPATVSAAGSTIAFWVAVS